MDVQGLKVPLSWRYKSRGRPGVGGIEDFGGGASVAGIEYAKERRGFKCRKGSRCKYLVERESVGRVWRSRIESSELEQLLYFPGS